MGNNVGKDAYKFKKDKLHHIGSGAYSDVFKGIRKEDQLKVAIKCSKDNILLITQDKK